MLSTSLCRFLLLTTVAFGWGSAVSAAQTQPRPSQQLPRTGCPKVASDAAPDTNTILNAPPNRVSTKGPLKELRNALKNVEYVRGAPLDGYIVTTDDEHQTGSPLSHDRRLQHISGFSGSNGEAVVTKGASALWTDPRYYTQADNELGCNWQLMRTGIRITPSMAEWIAQVVNKRGRIRIGADSKLIPHHVWSGWETEFDKFNISLVAVQTNLVDLIWKDRPEPPDSPMYIHDIEYTGETWQSKVKRVRSALKVMGADALVVTALDEVAWLLNLRGRDAMFLPVPRAYVLLTQDRIDMYVPHGAVPESVATRLRTHHCLNDYCVRVSNYEQFWRDLATHSQGWDKVLLPSAFTNNPGCSHRVVEQVPPESRMLQPSPVMMLKAVKNKVEVEGMRRAHVRDAAAICEFMAYYEDKMSNGERWTEYQVAQTLDRFRYEQMLNQGASFKTIVGFGPNGAKPHYRPQLNSSLLVADNSTLVIDSGGQYLDGTTDISRTFHFGKPTSRQKDAYTRVLAGLLSLSKLKFPHSVDTTDVDILARSHLWAAGMDYEHGTGHGIGSFLGVHEPPITIHYNGRHKKSFEVGHFFTVEPGFYQDGDFGIRLENVLEVYLVKAKFNVSGPYYGFRMTTLVPYEPKLIDADLLTPDLRKLINEYNSKVRHEVGAELKRRPDLKGFRWMMKKTGYIPEWAPPKNAAKHFYGSFTAALLLCTVAFLV